MTTPTIEIIATQDLERALKRLAAMGADLLETAERKEFQILLAEVTRARCLQVYNDSRQIRLALPL